MAGLLVLVCGDLLGQTARPLRDSEAAPDEVSRITLKIKAKAAKPGGVPIRFSEHEPIVIKGRNLSSKLVARTRRA